jgi:hypothetical protein
MGVPAYKLLRDGLPLIAVLLVRLEKPTLVQRTPETVVDFRIEVIVPSRYVKKYLSLHCLPVLSNSVSAHSFSEMRGHFLVPNLATRRTICWSSWIWEAVPLPTTGDDPWTSISDKDE